MADAVVSATSVAHPEALPRDVASSTVAVPARKVIRERTLARRGGWWPIPLLLILFVPVFYWNLGNYGLVNGDEGFYHRIAQNMVRSGDWLTVQWNGELRVYETFMNSPLQHWMRAALITFFDYNYWTMRVLSATAGALAVLFTYKLARQFMTSGEAFLAALLLMVSYQFVFLHGARTGELDAIITFIFVWLAWSFVRALRHNKSFIPHHLVLLALINIKLPVIIMPLAFEAAFLLFSPRYWRHIKRWVITALCLCPIFISWHIYQLFDLGPKPVFTVLSLMADQASGDELQPTRHSAPVGLWEGLFENARFYGRNLLFGGFPYIAFAPVALLAFWRGKKSPRTRDFMLITALAMGAVLAFYCVVSRRFPWYVIPAYPFIAILTARFLFRMDRLGRGLIMTVLTAAGAAWAMMIRFRGEDPNPFAVRAMSFSPKPGFVRLGELENWQTFLTLMAGALLLIVVIRFLTRRLPVRSVPILIILPLLIIGGMRIAEGLQYTNYISRMEKFAINLAKNRAKGVDINFPIDVPLTGAQNLVKYHFGDNYLISTAGKEVRLVRPLKDSEKTTMKRADLKANMILSPLGTKSKKPNRKVTEGCVPVMPFRSACPSPLRGYPTCVAFAAPADAFPGSMP